MIERYDPSTHTYIVFDPLACQGDPWDLFAKADEARSGPVYGPSRSVTYVTVEKQSLAHKHYRRRGWMAHVSGDQYFGEMHTNSRMWREFQILSRLWVFGLPVPRPVAARCRYRRLLRYSGDLIMQRLEGVSTLREALEQGVLPSGLWHEVGDLIAQFHRRGVYHDDLNASNILLQASGKLYLIDFDHGEFRPPSNEWMDANLKRLLRSLTKLSHRCDRFHFSAGDWEELVRGHRERLSDGTDPE